MENNEREAIEISITDILSILIQKWWVIALSIVLCAAVMFIYSVTAITPVYGLGVAFYVSPEFGNAQATTAVTAYQTSTLAKDSIKTYIELLSYPEFFVELEGALEGQCSQDYTAGQLKSMISYSNKEGTDLIDARIVAADKNDVYTIAKELEKSAPARIEGIVGNKALTPSSGLDNNDASNYRFISRVNDFTSRNTVLGALIGAIISAIVVILIKMFDVRINEENDLKRSYDIQILGVIPKFEDVLKSNQNKSAFYGGKTGENSKK